ncbi:hypothetical protein BT96DRAFT_125731 [Gymnopus androsaceus JB14]|uniref:Uncharacterized protein n=1 Tax=Gymnopus androsaceus JB14 TaxID=1447944 RepID=A0A6A4HCG1_9AGAR|nr:hypothetical protein BT96DRAFT_125731 [Gymnopus androsaceus JB14]
MEEDPYFQRPVSAHSVYRRNSPRSSRPVPYPKQGSRRAISSSSPHDRSTLSGSDDSLTWATEDLKKRFKDVYRKHGSLKERRDLNIKNKHIGCKQCADRGIQCTIRPTALRCGQCPAYVKCTRVNILKKLRVTKLIDISEEQYDYLLRWYKQHEEEELLKPLEETLLKASIGVSQNAETSVVHPNRAPCQYPPSTPPTESECDSQTSSQSSFEIRGNTRTVSPAANEHDFLNQQKHSSYSSSLISKHSPPEAYTEERPDHPRTMTARTDFQAANAALQNCVDTPSQYTSSSESACTSVPTPSMYNHRPPITPDYSPPPPYHSPPHLYAPVPLTSFPNNSVLKHEYRHNAAGSSGSNAASTTSSSMRFGTDNPYSLVAWNQDAILSTYGSGQTMVAGAEDLGDNRSRTDYHYSFEFGDPSEVRYSTYSEDPYARTNHRNIPPAPASSYDRSYGDTGPLPHPFQFRTSEETNMGPGPSVEEFESHHLHYGYYYYQNQGPRPNPQVRAIGGQSLPPSLRRVMY